MKNKDIRIETHFANEYDNPDYGNMNITNLDINDFFNDPDEKNDHFIEDGSVKKYNLSLFFKLFIIISFMSYFEFFF